MRLRRAFPRLAVGALVIAVLGALVLTRSGGPSSEAATPAPIRADPAIGPFQGLGVWVDIYDDAAWADPAAAVADMAARGVRTLYLQTSNDSRSSPFVFRAGVVAFLDAAAADGVQVVAWYLPGFADLRADAYRAKAAIGFATPAGSRFDGFALDIESPQVADPALRTRRLLTLSDQLRAFAGDAYPLGAIVPSPRGMQLRPGYWPGFPWTSLAQTYDAILPMTYFTFRTSGADGALAYVAACVRLVRSWVGNDLVPIHMIGGLAQDADAEETAGFVDGVRTWGLIGASYYTWPGITDAQWRQLEQVPPNPVGDPPLPVRPGAPALGNVPGADTSHPHEVAYVLSGRAGDRSLTFDAFDPGPDEIAVWVNGSPIATVPAGTSDAWTPESIRVPDDALHDDTPNSILFVAAGDAPVWGVRDLALPKA